MVCNVIQQEKYNGARPFEILFALHFTHKDLTTFGGVKLNFEKIEEFILIFGIIVTKWIRYIEVKNVLKKEY